MKNIVLLAVQGAGKGTLAKELSKRYGYVHISMGDILRERASVGDELGLKIKNLIDQGLFVPNDIVFQAVEYRIKQSDCDNGFILDGFPRTLEQAHGYQDILERLGKDLGIVVNLTLPMDLLTKRIIGRRMCKDCGAIYNIYSKELKPIKEGICNNCGGELYQRADDNLDAMKVRVDNYFKVTEPLINYYKEKGILYEVDSSELIPMYNKLDSILKSLGDRVD